MALSHWKNSLLSSDIPNLPHFVAVGSLGNAAGNEGIPSSRKYCTIKANHFVGEISTQIVLKLRLLRLPRKGSNFSNQLLLEISFSDERKSSKLF